MKVLVVVPTYNECENIAPLVERLLRLPPHADVLIVDDHSPDGTGRLADEMARADSRVQVLHRPRKEGIGPAYVAGFKHGLASGYEIVFQMDADLSHRPRYLTPMLEKLQTCDMVSGSRWVRGGRTLNWPLWRLVLSRAASLYAAWVLGVRVKDLTGGFNGYRRRVLEDLKLDEIRSDGYAFQIEMKYRALRMGYRLEEVPIVFTDRTRGGSKISKRIIWEALGIVWVLRFLDRSVPHGRCAAGVSKLDSRG